MFHVVILSSNTGGGHRACAEALKAQLETKYANQTRVSIVDLWSDHAPCPLKLLPQLYPFLVQYIPSFWGLLWRATKSPRFSSLLFSFITKRLRHHILATLHQLAPDLIICVHPIVQRALLPIIHSTPTASSIRSVPWFTVVTDLSASHPFWFDPRATLCFVDGPISAHHAQKNGLSPKQIRAHGLPVHPNFCTIKNQIGETGIDISARAKLLGLVDLDPTLPTALVIGGGDGIGPVAQIAEKIAHQLSTTSGPLGQLVLICGHNRSLLNTLQQRAWPIPVRLCGFVQNMPQWMAAADCVVTKAGPSTIMESLTMGKPVALMGYIPGQESNNVTFVVQSGAGLYHADPDELARVVYSWLVDAPQTRSTFAATAQALATPLACSQIVDDIIEIIAERRIVDGNSKFMDQKNPIQNE